VARARKSLWRRRFDLRAPEALIHRERRPKIGWDRFRYAFGCPVSIKIK
jgi:hypothetical protein